MLRILRRLRRDDSGATAIEYGLLAALLCVAAIGAFTSFGDGLMNMWGHVGDKADESMPSS